MNTTRASWSITPHGGVMTPSALRAVAELSMSRGSGRVCMNARQQLLLHDLDRGFASCDDMAPMGVRIERAVRGLPPSIVTTLPALGLTTQTPWLTRRAFEKALAVLQPRGTLTIGVADPTQRMLPVYGNMLNFLAAEMPDTWHVALATHPGTRPVFLEGTVYTSELDEFARKVTISQSRAGLAGAAASLPHRDAYAQSTHGDSRYAHGRYDRLCGVHSNRRNGVAFFGVPVPNEGLPAGFVHDVCVCALRDGIGTVGLSPWNTLIFCPVSGMDAAEILRLMALHRVSDRVLWTEHWYESPSVRLAHVAKNLRATLHETCPTSGGLSLGMICRHEPMPDTDIVVVVEPNGKAAWPWSSQRFGVYIHRHGARFEQTATRVGESKLARSIVDAMDVLFTVMNAPPISTSGVEAETPQELEWSCIACGTTYSESLGDPMGGVVPGTPFDALPESWACPVCGEPKAGIAAGVGQASGF